MQRTVIDKELLDVPGSATRAEIEGNLRDIAAANRWLGGTSVVLGHLTRLIGRNTNRRPIRILDLATGCADIPAAIVRWASKRDIAVRITAVDKNPDVVRIARENTRMIPEIAVEQQNILTLPYPPRAFDFVTCSQIIHHLSSEEVVTVLRTANRLSTQGIVVSDLHRRPFCISLAGLGSHLLSNRLSRHDARVSFPNAFTPQEIRELAEAAELVCYTLYAHWPCRTALVVDKRGTACKSERVQAYHALAVV